MNIIYVNSNKKRKQFKQFRIDLYKNDPYYVSTIEFTCDMLLYKETEFCKKCDIVPIMVYDNKILCEAFLVKNPGDNFVQISFFEALENQNEAVELLISEAKKFAQTHKCNKIIIGMNGHLSYGLGFSVDIKNPNTFDSTYTKLYYNDYFKNYLKHELVAFSNNIDNVLNNRLFKRDSIEIRPIDLKNFKEEMEIFRNLCDETIGKTFLYSKTSNNHFYDLIKDMLFFLKPENILFAYEDNTPIGFVFWHPDYNEILRKGKQNSLLSIAIMYILNKNKIKKMKINAIGVLDKYQGIGTISLLNEVSRYVEKYETVETNFVWCNNLKSMKLNNHLIGKIERRFAIYEVSI